MHSSNDDLLSAFAQLQQSLRSYLRKRVADPTLAEDLLQDVFVKALASRKMEQPIENLTGWLYTVTRTILADYYRTTRPQMEVLDENIVETAVDDLQIHQELSTCLRPFIEQLPPLYRDTLIATEFQGKTLRVLAESQHVSVSAIKSRAARARIMLREKILACCHVEIADGLVNSYTQLKPSDCCVK